MNKYFIIIIGLLLTALYTSYISLQKANDNIDRLEENFTQLHSSNTTLRLTLSEFEATMSTRMDSVIKSSNIKPKWIKEYIEINHHYHNTDTNIVTVTIDPIDNTKYNFREKIECFNVEGFISLKEKLPKLTLTTVGYNTKIDYIIYQNRKEWKFLFVKSRLFGSKQNKLYISSDCGETEVKHVNIVKK
jgi:hypothetical protein